MRATLGRTCGAGGRRRLRARGPGGAGEVVQVGALGLVELQGAGEAVEDAVGDAGEVAAFELGVVLDADAGQVGDLLRRSPGTRRWPP